MMNPKGKRIFAWTMAVLMALMVVAPVLSAIAYAEDDFSEEKDQIAGLSDRYKDLQKKQDAVQAKLNQTQSEKQKQVAIKQEIGGQIDMTREQITLLEERIALLEDRISEKEKEMGRKQDEIDENYGLFKQRLRAMCAVRQTTNLGLVLGADDFSQMLTRTAVVTRVAEHDSDLIDGLNVEMDELREIKESIEADRSDVQADKDEMDQKKQELDGKLEETQKQIQDIAALEQQFLANKAQIQAQMKQVQAEIDKIYLEINKKSAYAQYIGGRMSLPAPSLYQITSEYGYRFNGSDFHTGVDYSGAGAYGSTIAAANTGTVAFVNTRVTPGYGYGKYLIIDHGGGISTLYGHCSAIDVQVGDVVARGEKIAEVGSTGWSTGPHVHFEVRENGKHVNPMTYLRG